LEELDLRVDDAELHSAVLGARFLGGSPGTRGRDFPDPTTPIPSIRHARGTNEPAFDVRSALYTMLGADLSQIHGFGPYTVLRLVAECGDDMRKWPTAKHFTSWLTLAPGNKISGGRVLSGRTRRSANRAAALLRIAAVNIGKTRTALGAFYRRLAARVGKAKAVTATARKLAVLFYNALRFGVAYADPAPSTTRSATGSESCTTYIVGLANWDSCLFRPPTRMRAMEFLRKVAGMLGIPLNAPDLDEND